MSTLLLVFSGCSCNYNVSMWKFFVVVGTSSVSLSDSLLENNWLLALEMLGKWHLASMMNSLTFR